MQLTFGLPTLVAGLLACAVAPAITLAQESGLALQEDEREGAYLFRFFADSDDVHVVSHYGAWDGQVTPAARLAVQWNHERVTVPGVQAPVGSEEAVDAITTASRPISQTNGAYTDYLKIRNEATAKLDYRRLRVGYYLSRETDYLAQQLETRFDHDLFERSLNLSFGTSYGWDDIAPLTDDDTPGQGGARRTWHGNITATQIVTSTTIVRVGAEANRVSGLQHSPYRNVYAAGTHAPERHPDERLRRNLFVRVSQWFSNESSVWVDYKLYGDDWGVHSQTAAVRLAQRITPAATFECRYRFYSQGSADFFLAEYPTLDGVDGYRTGDYRLGEFDAHLFGTRLDLALGELIGGPEWTHPLRLGLGYERYFNTNDFSANVLETGVSLPF